MKHPRVLRVTAIAALLAAIAIWLFVYTNQASDPAQTTYRRTLALEEKAKRRFTELRGLTPCDYDDRRWLVAAERKLALAGQPPPRALILVAPTFSDMRLLAFGSTGLDRYTFPQQPAFGPEFTENDQVLPKAMGSVSLAPNSYERVVAAVSRNTRYAMSSRESGRDGVVYYFQVGADQCGIAWSPTEGTMGGGLGKLVDLLLADQPPIGAVDHTLSALERLELAH